MHPPARRKIDVDRSWPDQLAPRLFTPPARWGWQAVDLAKPAAVPTTPPAPRPVWTESPPPDTSALRAARSKAVSRLVRRVAVTVVLSFAFVTYQNQIEAHVSILGDSARQVYVLVALLALTLLVIGLIRAASGVGHATRNIRRFEQPYQTYRAAEQERHRQAVQHWELALRQHAAQAAEAAWEAERRATGPQWYPVAPAAQPTRIDVLGGDHRRHGWASLLVTLGTSVLAHGERITLLDLTGQEVGGGLLQVAQAAGRRTRLIDLATSPGLDLFGGLTGRRLGECLAHTLLPSGDLGERVFASDALRRVLDCLDGTVTLGRLAAGVAVLRRGTGDERLSADEASRLVDAHLGDIDQSEWTHRQLRFLASRLEVLSHARPSEAPLKPLWTDDDVSVVATDGNRDDRNSLLDRLLVQLAHQAMAVGGLAGVLVVAGGDHIGAEQLQALADQARQAAVRLALLIDQPQGDLERTLGTGGAVCIMKMYNHGDASVAAEFIGRGHRFVVNQITWQVGKAFSDTGGDSFAATTGQGADRKQARSGLPGQGRSLSESRGHAWTGSRSWTTSDNISASHSSGRVYELMVEPQEILGLPETSFILVDNTGSGRRVIMADANPGICILDRVSSTPLREGASR